MKTLVDLNDLLVEQLRELYDAEMQLIPFLENLGWEARDSKLTHLLTEYRKTSSDNNLVLKQVFNDLFTQKRGEKNETIRLMEERTGQLLKRCETNQVKDAAIIISLQHIIHFKIASYGAVTTYAKILGLYEDAAKLHRLVDVEKKMDRQLVILADGEINRKAHFEEEVI